MNSTKAIFLQVRLDSSRLPGKAVLKLKGKTIIEHAMESLMSVPVDRRFLLTTYESKPPLELFAKPYGFEVFAGSKENVLERFVLCARENEIGTIVRATGDNPIVSSRLATTILGNHLDQGADFSCFTQLPLGVGVEIINVDALEKAYDLTDQAYDKEHVAPFLYNNPKLFKLNRKEAPPEVNAPNIRVSLDTVDDFSRLVKVFDALYSGVPIETDQLIQYWNNSEFAENPA